MKKDKFLKQTLQEIEKHDWGEPTYPSYLVTTCHRLRRVLLKDFTVEDLRIMIGQKIGLPYLVPLALDILHDDPMAQGDMFPGDLLTNVARVPDEFWRSHPRLKRQWDKIIARLEAETVDAKRAASTCCENYQPGGKN